MAKPHRQYEARLAPVPHRRAALRGAAIVARHAAALACGGVVLDLRVLPLLQREVVADDVFPREPVAAVKTSKPLPFFVEALRHHRVMPLVHAGVAPPGRSEGLPAFETIHNPEASSKST